ncbi:MAG: low molecular weight phosphatase family protein [Cellulomonadaceae bacterium]
MHHDFTILTVCTGNICRSPAAERLLARRLSTGVTVRSAGLQAVSGAAISEPMRPLIDSSGAPSSDFTARQITPAMIQDADLVLTMTRTQRTAVVEMVPAAVRRTFTLRELGDLAATVPAHDVPDGTLPERLRALIPLAAAHRAQRTLSDSELDIADPFRQSARVYAASFAQIQDAVNQIVAAQDRGRVPQVTWAPLTGDPQ